MSRPGVDPVSVPAPPETAERLFGEQLPKAAAYAALLGDDGVAHGHLGPREVPRIWTRHLNNSALLADLLPEDAVVVDVGSGAGLPGIPVAIRRPDLSVLLLEPMQRRCDFLVRAIAELGLGDRVTVTRGRADDRSTVATLGPHDWVVARAVAPLNRLVRWCVPLLTPAGRLLALKGESAVAEVAEHRDEILRLGVAPPTVVELGGTTSDERTWVVSVQQQAGRRRTARR